MKPETRAISLRGNDYLLTKTTVSQFGSPNYDVEKLTLSRFGSDGVAVPVRTKEIKTFSGGHISYPYVSKEITRKNLINDGRSVVEVFRNANSYPVKRFVVDIPNSVDVDYSVGRGFKGSTKLDISKIDIHNLSKETLANISNSARKIIKHLFTLR